MLTTTDPTHTTDHSPRVPSAVINSIEGRTSTHQHRTVFLCLYLALHFVFVSELCLGVFLNLDDSGADNPDTEFSGDWSSSLSAPFVVVDTC